MYTLLSWNLVHLATFTVLQNALMPSIKCSWGFTSRQMYSFNSCHKHSIGLQSGDSGGVFHQLILFWTINSAACREVCFGSLSCINLWPPGYFSAMNGKSVELKIWVLRLESIILSNIQIWVGPLRLIPAHTCSFKGCLGLQETDYVRTHSKNKLVNITTKHHIQIHNTYYFCVLTVTTNFVVNITTLTTM